MSKRIHETDRKIPSSAGQLLLLEALANAEIGLQDAIQQLTICEVEVEAREKWVERLRASLVNYGIRL